MRALQFHRFSKARIWQDEDPFSGFVRVASLAVEIVVPRGATAEYGLLGASFEAGSSQEVALACGGGGSAWAQSLAGTLDDVRIELPAEYHSEIVRRARDCAIREQFVGRIVFDRAAHGMVGSSSSCFGALAELVVELLVSPNQLEKEGRLVELLTSLFHPRG